MKSVTKHSFQAVPQANIQRSSFDRSHGHKTTFNVDDIVPIFVDEILPGDTCKINLNAFGRLATPIHPILDNMSLDTFWFFVPMRLVWDNYYKFFGGQDNPGDSTDYLIPTANSTVTNQEGGLADYMGLPLKNNYDFNCLPMRAYHLIWSEWFRDQNLQDNPNVNTGDSAVIADNWNDLRKRGKRHDYFTSALPWAQKGDVVQVPLGDKAYVGYDAIQQTDSTAFYTDGVGGRAQGYVLKEASGTNIHIAGIDADEDKKLYADLASATAATINDWRQAFQIQKFLERDARSGTRYTEKVLAHFGVSSPDARLQRPEYLGGGTTSINVHPVTQTSSTDATTPQGNMSGFGTVSENKSGFNKSFTEHGYVIGLANARADLTYSQGLDRMWSRKSQYDFYFPSFAHLGEQAILNKELYLQATSADDDVFGYQERYAEYRYKKSMITGKFRPDATGSLDAWHLSQDFASLPTLGETFIESNTPIDRVVAVPSEPDLIVDMYFNYKHIRPMPVYAPPGMIDHF